MGDVGLINHESKKIQNHCTMFFFTSVVTILLLFISLLTFIYFTINDFYTSYMIIETFITICFECIILRPIACIVISCFYMCHRRAKIVNLSRKSHKFENAHKKYPRSYVTG